MCGGSPLFSVTGDSQERRCILVWWFSPLFCVGFLMLFQLNFNVGEITQVGVLYFYSRSPLSEPEFCFLFSLFFLDYSDDGEKLGEEIFLTLVLPLLTEMLIYFNHVLHPHAFDHF